MQLENKVAIVTGAATGIGQAIAIRFRAGGCVRHRGLCRQARLRR